MQVNLLECLVLVHPPVSIELRIAVLLPLSLCLSVSLSLSISPLSLLSLSSLFSLSLLFIIIIVVVFRTFLSISVIYYYDCRCVQDFCYGESWNVGSSSLIVWAVNAAPSKDTLWTSDNGRFEVCQHAQGPLHRARCFVDGRGRLRFFSL